MNLGEYSDHDVVVDVSKRMRSDEIAVMWNRVHRSSNVGAIKSSGVKIENTFISLSGIFKFVDVVECVKNLNRESNRFAVFVEVLKRSIRIINP